MQLEDSSFNSEGGERWEGTEKGGWSQWYGCQLILPSPPPKTLSILSKIVKFIYVWLSEEIGKGSEFQNRGNPGKQARDRSQREAFMLQELQKCMQSGKLWAVIEKWIQATLNPVSEEVSLARLGKGFWPRLMLQAGYVPMQE